MHAGGIPQSVNMANDYVIESEKGPACGVLMAMPSSFHLVWRPVLLGLAGTRRACGSPGLLWPRVALKGELRALDAKQNFAGAPTKLVMFVVV